MFHIRKKHFYGGGNKINIGHSCNQLILKKRILFPQVLEKTLPSVNHSLLKINISKK